MTILVTGSAGHLGEGLMRHLRDAGQPVRGLDIKPSTFTDIVGSIADPVVVADAMAGVDAVLHTATLHKPHVGTHARQAFVDTNVTGTLTLLEAAVAARVGAFVFTSTTSTFGSALRPPPGALAAWVTEEVRPVPRNIYGVTKTAAEELCELFHRTRRLPVIVLRTARFFPEEDDDPARRAGLVDANIKANEFLYRRADLQDIVDAHLLAAARAPELGFGRYIVSATTPFRREDLDRLNGDAPTVLGERVPEYEAVYSRLGWRMFDAVDRVYVNDAARRDLGWRPAYDFARVLRAVAAGEDPRSPLARAVGAKGYHDAVFADGPYPVEAD
ncbi:MAG: NAD(P)-dependent oxidoreductase [Azospirillaceae bacterium]